SPAAPPRQPRHAGSASHANIPGSSPIGHGCTVPGGQDDKSPVTRDCHAGICGSRRVKPPPATLRGEHLIFQTGIRHAKPEPTTTDEEPITPITSHRCRILPISLCSRIFRRTVGPTISRSLGFQALPTSFGIVRSAPKRSLADPSDESVP